MSDWSKQGGAIMPPILPCFYSIIKHSRIAGGVGSFASGAWPTANLAIAVPFTVTAPYVVRRVWSDNGATASGNIDIGIFSLDGTKIASCGSTAMSGTSTLQLITITETLLTPGRYLMAMACSNTTGTNRKYAAPVTSLQMFGVAQASAAVPMTSLTLATPANAFLPVFGLASITLF